MAGIDPNNVAARWLNAKMRAWRTRFHASEESPQALAESERILADARREPREPMLHGLRDMLSAVAALRQDAESRGAGSEVEELDERSRVLEELVRALGP